MIYLSDVLRILPKNQIIRVFSENGDLLFFGFSWVVNSKYLLSCPVLGLNRYFNIIEIIIAYD